MIVADLDRGGASRLQGTFDAIVSGTCLEHLTDPLPVLVALNRALAPDGRGHRGRCPRGAPVGPAGCRAPLLERWDYVWTASILDRERTSRFFTRRSFAAFLRDAGLGVDEMVATPVPLPLVVPARLHGRVLDAVHALSAGAAAAPGRRPRLPARGRVPPGLRRRRDDGAAESRGGDARVQCGAHACSADLRGAAPEVGQPGHPGGRRLQGPDVSRSRATWAWSSSSTTGTTDTAPTRKPATPRRSRPAPTSS